MSSEGILKKDNHSERSRSGKSTTGSHASISVTLPSTNVEDLRHNSPVQVRSLSPERQKNGQKGANPGRRQHSSRTFSPCQSSGTVPPMATPTRPLLSDKELEYLLSARIIEKAWLSYRDRQMFKLLKHAVCAAEHSLSAEILRKVSPKEAELLKDKCMHSKVRFRFGGSEFPPLIFFKVYSSVNSGMGVKYVSGKKMIQPASEAARDACDLMGHRKFYDQFLQDTVQHEQHKITDEVDVTTLKDYMQYLSFIDETPAYMGGRDNSWRKLTLEVLPRQTIFFDIVDFLYSKRMSEQLMQQMPELLALPRTEDVQLKHIEIISKLRSQTPSALLPTPKSRHPALASAQGTGRRSKQALSRARKMRHLYEQEHYDPAGQVDMERQGTRSTGRNLGAREQTVDVVLLRGDYAREGTFNDGGYGGEFNDQEAEKLYEWTQQLSLEDMMATPRIPTA